MIRRPPRSAPLPDTALFRARNDGIVPDRARCSRRTRIGGGDVVGVIDAGDRSTPSPLGIAVEPAPIRTRDRKRRWVDRELPIVRSDDIVAELVVGIDQRRND